METDNETNPSSIDSSESVSLPKSTGWETKKRSINLLKRSKHDLLRLLSILEGELEARDIVISTLHAQLNNQRNARHQYYVHQLTDPLLSLHRDDYIFCTAKNDGDQARSNEAYIEPLPLLEKVVYQFKSQQQKMHQQMALASKIHRKMARELAEEKRKHALDTKTGDDVTMALEKERERLKANVMCERKRTKRIETEYKKLLALCKEEGKKHKIIVMGLLAEQERLLHQLKLSRELQIDIDSTETELQAKLHEALDEKQNLANRLKEEQVECSGLKTRMANLERQVVQLNSKKILPNNFVHQKSVLEEAAVGKGMAEDLALPHCPAKMSEDSSHFSNLPGDSASPRDIAKQTLSSFFAKHHPMSVAQSTQDVMLVPTKSHPPILLADGVGVTTSGYYSVKPGSSIAGLEAMKSLATSKDMLRLDFSGKDSSKMNSCEKIPQSRREPQAPNPSGPPKPNKFIPGSPRYAPFRSPHSIFNDKSDFPIASSPTSGAANFAMNSPNSPTPPLLSPFLVAHSPTVKPSSKFQVTKFEPDTKLKGSSPGLSPAKSEQSSQFLSARMKFQNPVKSEIAQRASKENVVAEKRFQGKKFTSVTYKSHLAQKVTTSPSTTSPDVVKSTGAMKQDPASLPEPGRIKQPLPLKTKPCTTATANSSQVRPPPPPPKKLTLSRVNSAKSTNVASNGCKSRGQVMQRKSGNVKGTPQSIVSLKVNTAEKIGNDAELHPVNDERKD